MRKVSDLRRRVALLFREAQKRLEILEGRSFRSDAYRKAAEAVRALNGDDMLRDPENRRQIRGIGAALNKKIDEIIHTGTFEALERLRKQVPDGLLEILRVRGLGPGAVRQLWHELGIRDLEGLHAACREGRLEGLKGWTARRIRQVCEETAWYLTQRSFRLYADVEAEAEELLRLFRDAYIAQDVHHAGDYRRKMPLIDRLRFLFITDEPNAVHDFFVQCAFLEGEAPPFLTQSGLPIEYVCAPADEAGTRWVEATGSDAFLQAVGPLPTAPDEETLFQKIGWPVVPPPMREDLYNETQLKRFPYAELVAPEDIQGVVHVHTHWSDGVGSVEDMVRGALDAGFTYIALCDHSKSSRVAGGLDEARFEAQWREIDRVQEKFPQIKIIKGVEVDILKDGTLDFSPDFLRQFELVIASIHQPLDIDADTATSRILKAIESGVVHIIAHPSGRLLTRRRGYPLHYDTIFHAAADHGVALELNANPYRLDLDWRLIPQAAEAGCCFSINPDAHSIEDFDYIRYGVYMAQKGGLLKERVLNTRSAIDYLSFFRR